MPRCRAARGRGAAEAAVSQAEARLAQAQAAVAVLELQLARLANRGLWMARCSLLDRSREFAAAGSIAMTIANLEQVRLTVYAPEDEYGLIALGRVVR